MQQRLMLAIALLSDPPVLLLDEPTANLDVNRQVEFRNLISLLVKEGKTVVLTTHLLGDVDHIAEKIMLLNKGKLNKPWSNIQKSICGMHISLWIIGNNNAKVKISR